MFEISRILGIEGLTIWGSFKYLGVPIFKSKPKTSDWSPLTEKFKKKNPCLESGLAKLGKEVGYDEVCSKQLSYVPMFHYGGSNWNSRQYRRFVEILPLARREKQGRKEILSNQLAENQIALDGRATDKRYKIPEFGDGS